MKTIELKNEKEKLVFNGQNVEIDMATLELIETVVNSPLKEGITASDMLSRIKILDKVRDIKNDPKAPKELSLEDVDYKKLAEYVGAMKWSVVSRFVLEFTQQFEK